MDLAAVNSTSGATALLQAFESGELGLSFGIAGFLLGYLAGAAYLLLELGIITPMTKIAGASSGALLTMGLCSGVEPDRLMQNIQQLSNICRAHANCQGTLGSTVGASLETFLPPEAWKRCRNRGYMSITIGNFPSKAAYNKIVTDYTSNADLAAAASASSYIPLWSGHTPVTTFRGSKAYDGFFSNSQPCPPGVKACIRINSKNPPWDNKKLHEFFGIFGRGTHAGKMRPVRLSALPQGLSLESSAAAAAGSTNPDPAKAMQAAAALGVDIAPGLYSPTKMSTESWEELMILPGDEALNKYLWGLGRRDALIWARATGLEAAAAAKRASYRVYAQG